MDIILLRHKIHNMKKLLIKMEQLAKDVLEIITVFSARLYGSRSNKNKKLLEEVNKAVTNNVVVE